MLVSYKWYIMMKENSLKFWMTENEIAASNVCIVIFWQICDTAASNLDNATILWDLQERIQIDIITILHVAYM